MQSLVIGGVACYTLTLAVLMLLWTVAPRWTWWIEVSNIFAVYLVAPLVLLLPILLWLRSWKLGAAIVVLLLVFILVSGQRLFPARCVAPPTTPWLRVVTLNQMHKNSDIQGSVAQLLAQQADVIALQELSPAMTEVLEQEQVADRYPYRLLYPDERFEGIGLMSRYPLDHTERFADMRGVRARLHIDGRTMTLLTVHPRRPSLPMKPVAAWFPLNRLRIPTYNTALRDAELERVLARVRTIEGPLVVMGDFNTADREPLYRRFAALLRDAYRETGWGWGHTYPHSQAHAWQRCMPPLRIDYIWSSSDMVPIMARVNCRVQGSDHCMLIADLAFAE